MQTAEELFAGSVRTLRAMRRMTQAELARRMSEVGHPLDQSAIARLEAGTRSIRLDEAVAVAQIFGHDLDRLTRGHVLLTIEEVQSRAKALRDLERRNRKDAEHWEETAAQMRGGA